MKTTSTLFTAIGLLSVAALTSSAETAYTPPVMAASTELGEGYSVLGINALNEIEATGVIDSIDSVDGDGFTTLSVSNVPADWATHDFDNQGGVVEFNFRNVPLYYVEITSGDKEGQIIDVVATSAGSETTLTVGADLTGMDVALGDATFVIRPKYTIASFFGEHNEVGLTGASSFGSADLIYALVDGEFKILFYQDAPVDSYDGWRYVGNIGTDVGGLTIDPDFGLIVFRRDSEDAVSVISVGDVKLGTARTLIEQGYNPIQMKFPVGMTLGNSGLYAAGDTVLQSGTGFGNADLVYILQDGEFNIYFYQDVPVDEYDGWRQVGDSFTDRSDTEIPSGAMIIVYRRGEVPVEWVKPQPFSITES